MQRSLNYEKRSNKIEPFFFRGNRGDIFTIVHYPSLSFGTAVIFCNPFAEEKLNSHRIYYNYANLLADRGILALRFDYWGTGDSDGDFYQASLESRTEDIISMVNMCHEKYSIKEIILLGLRLGGNLAMRAANLTKVEALILWAPILDVYNYFYELLRANLTSQSTVFKRILKDRKQLIEDLKNGGLVNIDGYDITWKLFENSHNYSLEEFNNITGNLKTLILDVMKNTARPNKYLSSFVKSVQNLSLITVKEMPFWRNGLSKYIVQPINIFNSTDQWIFQHSVVLRHQKSP